MNTIRTQSGTTATINHKGAELVSLKNADGEEFIWEGNPEFWGKHSPVLFPIIGTLKDNSYHYNGKQFHLPRHGFARDLDFKVVSKTDNSTVFSLQSSAETLKNYPFEFELQLDYTLTENSLKIGYSVFNSNDFDMLFSLGAHPAFALPGNFTDYSIEMEKEEVLQFHLLENDLISDKTGILPLENRKLPLTYQLFQNDALVFKSLKSKTITILRNDEKLLTVGFNDFPNLGIWTKKDAPFLCIEPWLGYADTNDASGNILEKEGIQLLQPKSRFECAFHIEIF